MTVPYPPDGLTDWGDDLKAYIDNTARSVPSYTPNRSYTGPASTDITSVSPGDAGGAQFNEAVVISGGALPANWPVEQFGPPRINGNALVSPTSQLTTASVATFRTMTDGDDVIFAMYGSPFMMDLYIDGKPYAANPITMANTSGLGGYGYFRITFPSAKMRLIEMRSMGGIVGCYSKKPYRFYKPPADKSNPSLVVVGDSFVAPSVMNAAGPGVVSVGAYLNGMYQRMAAPLGLNRMVEDGVGGSGFIAPGGTVPYGHATRLDWLAARNPDVIVVHGGGANDIYQGNSVAAIIAAATTYFTAMRAAHPTAKLVFVEGFAPPGFTPSTFNPAYTTIRQGVQNNLNTAGVKAYYLDVATTRPPIYGSGYVGATNGSGNSDFYVGADGVHLTLRGNEFARAYLLPKIARVLADKGDLAGSLI